MVVMAKVSQRRHYITKSMFFIKINEGKTWIKARLFTGELNYIRALWGVLSFFLVWYIEDSMS